MHALAVTPAIPIATVNAPMYPPPGRPNHNIAAYTAATPENAEKSNTSRLSHERRHIRIAR
jgi:hypothetical protein